MNDFEFEPEGNVRCGSSSFSADNGDLSVFDEWCQEVANKFKIFSLERKIILLQKLLDVASRDDRYFLINHAVSHLSYDLFVSLPTELQEYICQYLDVKSLLVACQVSIKWNEIISSFENIWSKICFLTSHERHELSSVNMKQKCVNALTLSKAINTGSLFHQSDLNAQELSQGQISGLDYDDGILIGCADNVVGIWRKSDLNLTSSFRVPHRISCIKYTDELIVLGHSTGYLTTWKVDPLDNYIATLSLELRSHSGVIVSVSVSTVINVVVSGATDFGVKIWSLDSGSLVMILANQTDWVIEVSLVQSPSFCNKTCTGYYNLLTMSKDGILLFPLQVTSGKIEDDTRFTVNTSVKYPLTCQLKSLIPGCHIANDNIVYTKRISEDYEGEAQTEMIFQKFRKNTIRTFKTRYNIRKLLAVGEKMALLLLHSEQISRSNLVVIELKTGRQIGGCYVPHSSSSTPNLSQITIGEVEWLNDICNIKPNDVIVALGLHHGQIRIVTWKEIRLQREPSSGRH